MFCIRGIRTPFFLGAVTALVLTAAQTQAQCQSGKNRQGGSQRLMTQPTNNSLLNTTQMNSLMTAVQQQQLAAQQQMAVAQLNAVMPALQQQQLVAQQQMAVAQLNAVVPALRQQQANLQSALQRATNNLSTLQDDGTTSAATLKAVQRKQTRLLNALQQNAVLLQQLTGQPAGFQGANNVGSLLRTP